MSSDRESLSHSNRSPRDLSETVGSFPSPDRRESFSAPPTTSPSSGAARAGRLKKDPRLAPLVPILSDHQ